MRVEEMPATGQFVGARLGNQTANSVANNPENQSASASVSGSSGSTKAALASDPRLVTAAHEFEAAMMKELLAPLQQDKSTLGDDDSEDVGSNSALQSFASDALGQALSEHGGIGIATSVLHKLGGASSRKNGGGKAESVSTGTGNHSGNSTVIGKPN